MGTENKNVVLKKIGNFIVHINTQKVYLDFDVYPILEWESLSDGKRGFFYIDKENEPDERETFEEGKCLKKLRGTLVWRGVWEDRLYFTDSEYCGKEIEELLILYNNHILPWCKKFIKDRDNGYSYD